jgi:DNA repair exonuclease SbcCD ATPase subunit
MKILSLRVRGSIGIKKGLGLDEIFIDFSTIGGLIAFSGNNGSAKTTVLEMLQPYARMVSRKGALQSHFFLRDSEKEFIFEMEGTHYKTLIKMDAESSRSPEGYIWKNDVSEIDGKISNYNQYIVKLFGSPELFFNSVFCSQGSKNLSDMTTGDLKKLFSEFLKLERYVRWEDISKQCRSLLISRASSLERDIESLRILTEGYAEAGTALSSAQAGKKALELRLIGLSLDLEKSEAELAAVQADIQKNELIKTEIAGLEDTQERLSAEIENDQRRSEIELSDLRTRYQAFKLDIVDLCGLLANQIEIKQAASAKLKLTADLAKDRKLLADLTRSHFAAIGAISQEETAANENLARQKRKIDLAKNNIKTLELKLRHAIAKETDLNKRDPECISKTCSFILSALAAHQDIPILTRTINERADNATTLEKAYSDTLKSFTASREFLKAKESDQKTKKETLETRINQFEDELEKVSILADELPKIGTALLKKQDLEKRQAENTADGKKTKDFWEKRIIEKRGQQFAALEIVKKKKAKIDMAAEEKLATTKQSISNLKVAITERTAGLAEKVKDIIKYEQAVAQKEQAQKELTDKTAEKDLVVAEASEWAYLKDACSAKGLRALEIDSVLPAIAAYANDLLIKTFGTQYTVRFQTQDEETGREILDIIVIGDDGSETLLENLSGGQRVWLLSALRLSLSLISKEKGGRNLLTGFADESDGTLDVGHAIEYVQMYRAFMGVGEFEDFCFISHKPETISLADHALNFGDGVIAIN